MEPEDKEMFAQALAMGFTPQRASEEAFLNLTPVQASMMSQDPTIAKRVNEIVLLDDVDMSKEHLRIARQLEADREFAYATGNPNAAINATVQRAKLLGVFIERYASDNRVAVSNPDQLSSDEWQKRFGQPGKKESE